MPRGLAALALAGLLACLIAAVPDDAPGAKQQAKGKGNVKEKLKKRKTREVIFVGNNWEGTADVIKIIKRKKNGKKRKNPRYRRIARLNIIPDKAQREAEINSSPVDLGYFLGIRLLVGEGNDQYVDDMYSTNDGRLMIVSRPSFKDVVAIRIADGQIVWRFEVDGQRSDHMGLSPDGKHV